MAPRNAFQLKILLGVVFMAVAYCGGAGRVDLWPGWCYAAFFALVLASSYVVLARVAPDLMVERVSSGAGGMPGEQAIVGWLALSPIVCALVAGFDARRNGVDEGMLAAVAGYAIGIAGMSLTHRAMAANRFYAPVVRIQKDRGHQVVDAGPYRLIRHPGNLGNVALNVATPLMLASRWAWIPAGISIVLTIVRTALEDRMLRRELPGYEGYARQTKYRLASRVW